MHTAELIFANDIESDLPEAPECWELEDFADLLGGQR
jgi:hypothetical protein